MSAKFHPTSTNLFLLFSRDKLVNQHWLRLRKCIDHHESDIVAGSLVIFTGVSQSDYQFCG